VKNINCKVTIFLFLIFFVPRALYFWGLTKTAIPDNPVLDAAYFHSKALESDNFLSAPKDDFSKAPLYPWIIRRFYYLFSPGPKKFIFFQIIVSSLGGMLFYLLCLRFLPSSWALAASAALAVYMPLIFYDSQILRPGFIIIFNLLFLHFLFHALDTNKKSYLFISGMILGFGVLLKETALLIYFLTLLWFVFIKWSSRTHKRIKLFFIQALTFSLGLIFVIAPLVMDNFIKHETFIIGSNTGGINFYTGMNPSADGHSPIPPGIQWLRILRTQNSWNITDPALISIKWWKKGINFIRSHPERALILTLKKLRYFISNHEYRNNFSLKFLNKHVRNSQTPAAWFSGLPWPGFSILAAPGLGLLFFPWLILKPKEMAILIIPAQILIINTLFFSCSRFRAPAMPLLILLSLITIRACIKPGFSLFKKSFFLLLFLFFIISGYTVPLAEKDQSMAKDYFMTAQIHYKKGELTKSLNQIECALTENRKRNIFDSNIYFFQGLICSRLQKYEKAIYSLKKALEISEDYTDASITLAGLLISADLNMDALKILEKALEYDPQNPLIHFNLALACEKMNMLRAAAAGYEYALKTGAPRKDVLNNLGMLLLKGSSSDRAKGLKLLEEAHKFAPDDPALCDSLGFALIKSDPARAGVLINKSLDMLPDNPGFRIHRAMLNIHLKDIESAKKDLEWIINNIEPSKITKQAREALKILIN
jgi:Tfp pilus assembly protein PilF/4-amino-4-deoxy-L-arabinose transferase-like glycosyltransferase